MPTHDARDPRITFLLDGIARRRADLEWAVGSVPPDLRDARPRTGGWSVAQVLEHLVRTEQGITKLLSGWLSVSDERERGSPFDEAAFLREMDMPFFLDRSRKIRGSQPAGVLQAEQAWAALKSSRDALVVELEKARGRTLERHSRPHPAWPTPLNAYQWVAFVGLHEARHAAQIDEIRSLVQEDAQAP